MILALAMDIAGCRQEFQPLSNSIMRCQTHQGKKYCVDSTLFLPALQERKEHFPHISGLLYHRINSLPAAYPSQLGVLTAKGT